MGEVEARLAVLAATGRGSTIDLSQRNLPAVEYRQLRLALAPGRVSAVSAAPQRCELHATVYPGVWWITRFHAQEDVAGEATTVAFATEVIEIGAVPRLRGRTDTAVRRLLQRLRNWARDSRSQPVAGGGEAGRGIRGGRGAMDTCPGCSPIRLLLAACALTAMIGAQPPAHADGGGTFSLYDADRNGHLDRQEFETFVASKRNRADIAEFWAFQRVDTDGDGRVSEQEWVDALLADIRRRQP